MKGQNSVLIPFTQAYNPNLLLGPTNKGVRLERKVMEVDALDENGEMKQMILEDPDLISDNQKHDVLLEFRCPDKWLVRMSKNATRFMDWEK